jgi:hypothetical protein
MATRWALLPDKDRFSNAKKHEVVGIVTAASGQHLSVRPVGGTAVDLLIPATVQLGTIGRDDTVIVDSHVSGANLVADHVVLLSKAVAVVAPTVTFLSAPPAETTARSATFDWSTDVPGTATICYLDSGQAPCTAPPYTASNLSPGSHIFRVSVMNGKGWSNPADIDWTITDPVTVQLTSTPTATTVATSATFGFTIVGDAINIMCSIDGSAYAACNATAGATTGTYTKTYSGLAQAPHIFGLYVSNVTDLSTITPYSWTVVAPVQAPVVTITAQPSTGTSTSGAVSFTATNSPTSITCALDGGGATPCTSPYSLSGLSIGSHTVTVSATNSGGTGSASTTPWTVQAPPPAPPVVTLTSAPSGSVASTSASIAWTATNSPTSTTCAIDGGSATACTSPKAYSGLAAGSHTVVVTATNAGGSGSATAAWTIVAQPVVTITAQPTDSTATSGAVSFTATNNPTTVTCALDGGTATACTSPYSMSNLAVGSHSVTVSATNIAGTGSATTTSWAVQAPPPAPPVVTITSAPSGSVASTSASIAWTATNSPTSTTCAIDGGSATACTSPKAYSGLAAGAHTVVVSATNAGGSGSATAAWTIVAIPVVTITAQPSDSTSTSGAVSFTATNSPTSVTCSLDGGAATACTSPYSMSNLSVAAHTVTVSATNIAGTGSATTTSWTVQPPVAGAPVVTITSAPSGSVASTSASIGWTATNSPTSTTCAIDGGAASACTSPQAYSGLAAGSHSVVVTATNAGGSGSATAAWTIVAIPVVTITSQPSTSTSTSGAVSFTTTNSPTSVTCSLDGGAATACTSPYSMTNLSVASHTVTVSATNIAGTGSATTTSWTVQPPPLPAPVVTITSAPSGSVASTSASIAWTATNSPTSTTCAIDGGAASACTSPKAYSGLAAGAHTVVVTATNATGSGSATAAWTIVAIPVVTITAQPSTSTSTSGVVSFTTTNSPTSVTCSLDAGTAAACTSPYSMTNLAVGSHSVTVSATNIAGTGSATTTAWTVQPPPLPAPVVTITSAPSGSTTATTASIAWTATNSPTSTTCKLDSGTAAACTSPASLTGLALGAHTYVITATNATGSGSATAAWTVVATPPTVSLTSTPVSTNAPSTATFQWTTGGGAVTSTMCSLDSAPSVSCASGVSYSSLTAGSHTFSVTVSNSGGSATASYSWTVAAAVSPPTISLTQAPTASTTATTATIAWTTTGTVTTTTCSYDGANYTPCASPVNLSGVTVASHTFVITVSNSGGSASQTASWTVSSGGSAPVNLTLPVFSPSTWKPRSGKNGTTGSITNGTWSNNPTGYSYQWYRCLNSSSFASCQTGAGKGPSNNGVTNYPGPIAGATSSSYHAVEADIEMYLRCVVTASNAAGSTDAVSAAAPSTQPS